MLDKILVVLGGKVVANVSSFFVSNLSRSEVASR